MPGCFSVRFFAVRRLPAVGIPVLKRAGRYGSRPFFVCVGGAPDLSAAMTRPCLRDAGTYDFRTKWFLIFFKKNRNPLFFCRPADRRPATLPPCHFAVLPLCRPAALPLCRPATLPPCHFAVLLLCRLAARRLAARRLAARCLVACRPLPCHLAVLPPCRPLPCRLARTAHAVSSPSARSGENPPAVKLRFLHDLTRAATKKRPRRGSFSSCRVSGQPQI